MRNTLITLAIVGLTLGFVFFLSFEAVDVIQEHLELIGKGLRDPGGF